MHLIIDPDDLDKLAELVAAKIIERLPKLVDDEVLLTEQEAAAFCKVQVHTLRDARRRGVLKCSRAGRFPRYSRAQLSEWLTGNK
jgi:hypothetical protein